MVELAEGYGFIAAFVAGVACRRVEARHRFHQQLHAFANSIEHAITALLLVHLGSVMPTLWPHINWRLTLIGFGLILVIRGQRFVETIAAQQQLAFDRQLFGFFMEG